jgi:membrane protein required for colicin V production
MTNLNWVDFIILALFLGSVGAGILRGFVKEIIAVLTWIVAIFIASKFATPVAAHFTSSSSVQSTLSSATTSIGFDAVQPVSLFAIGMSFVCIFIGILILGKIIGYFFSSAVQLTGMMFINGVLGGAFGFIRGFLLVTVIVFLVQLTAMAQESYWTESQLVPSFQSGVQWINTQVIPGFDALKNKAGEAWQQINNQVQSMNGAYRSGTY